MRVLVTDGGERAALATVRSLGRAGHRVDVVSSGERCLAGASRFAGSERRVPDPLAEPEAFTRSVREATADLRSDVLIPISEASLHAVLPRRETFGEAVIPWPRYAAFDAICDKARVHQAARSLGIAVPRQVAAADAAEAREAARRLGPPLVLKPSRSVVGSGDGARTTHVHHVEDLRELDDELESIPAEAFPVLVQDRIEGPGTGVFLLLWDDELLAAFCHRRILEKPPSGGVSVLRESAPLETGMLRSSRRLMERFDWRGVAMVEYKRDRATGTPYLMEINGRFWGSLQLAVDAGVDFPRLLVDAATGCGSVTAGYPVAEYEPHARLQWFWGRVDHEFQRCRSRRKRGDAARWLGACARSAGAFLSDLRVRHEVFRVGDPAPFVHETGRWLVDVAGVRSSADGKVQ